MTYKIILLRHGESTFSAQNKFCGWYDAELTPEGILQAKNVKKSLKSYLPELDIVFGFSSSLKRSKDTLKIISNNEYGNDFSTQACWELTERNYGALTGINRIEAVEKYGEERVNRWRRSYEGTPPDLNSNHILYPEILTSVQKNASKENSENINICKAESLKDTIKNRIVPCWKTIIIPKIKKLISSPETQGVIIVAHSNVLRGLVMYLDKVSEKEILKLNIPTGFPFLYELDQETMEPVVSMRFLEEGSKVEIAMEKVAGLTKK